MEATFLVIRKSWFLSLPALHLGLGPPSFNIVSVLSLGAGGAGLQPPGAYPAPLRGCKGPTNREATSDDKDETTLLLTIMQQEQGLKLPLTDGCF